MEIHVLMGMLRGIAILARGGNEQGTVPGLRRPRLRCNLCDQGTRSRIPPSGVCLGGDALIRQIVMASE